MKLFEFLAKQKIYVIRSMSYVGIFNFIMIFGTFKQLYNINISLFLLAPVGLLTTAVLGYLDYKFILRHETMHNNKQNDVKDQIDRIEKKVDKLINHKLYK